MPDTAADDSPAPDEQTNERPAGFDVGLAGAMVVVSLLAAMVYTIGIWFPRVAFSVTPLVAYRSVRLAYGSRKMTFGRKTAVILLGLCLSVPLFVSTLRKTQAETELNKMSTTIRGFLDARKDGQSGSEQWVFDDAAKSPFIVRDYSLVSSEQMPEDDPIAGWQIYHVSTLDVERKPVDQDWLFCAARFDRPSQARPDARVGWKIVYMEEAGRSSLTTCQKIGAAVIAVDAEHGDAQVQAFAIGMVKTALSSIAENLEPCAHWHSMAEYMEAIKGSDVQCQPVSAGMLCSTSPLDSTEAPGLLSTRITLQGKNGRISRFILMSVMGPLAEIFTDNRLTYEGRAGYLVMIVMNVERMILNIPKTWEFQNDHMAGVAVDRRIKSAFVSALGNGETTAEFGNGELAVSFYGKDLKDIIGDKMPDLKPGISVLVAIGNCSSAP